MLDVSKKLSNLFITFSLPIISIGAALLFWC